MPITPDAPFPKTQGDNLRSKDWNDAINELIRLDNAKANRSGDKFTGPLSVTALGVGSDAPPSGIKVKTLTRIDEGATGAGAWANIGSNAYWDGAWRLVDPTKAGVNLAINGEGGGQEFRFFRTEANAQNQRDIAVIGTGTSYLPGNVGIGTSTPSSLYALDVSASASKAIKLGLEGNGGGQLVIASNPNDNSVYLEAYNSAGNGHASELLLTGHFGQNVPQLTFNADHTQVNGDLRLANSDIYFTKTDHNHYGFGNTTGYAAIENAANYGALMILGRAGTDRGRKVKLWDYLEVNGDMAITGNLGTHGFDPKPKQNGWGGGIHTWDVEAEATIWARNGSFSGPRDLAENYESDLPLEHGDVVCMDQEHDRILPSKIPNDELVMGIVSSRPGFLLNAPSRFEPPPSDRKLFPVALSGCVPCKVSDENGPIHRGDLLTSSSTPGHAMKAIPITIDGHRFYRPGTIIGKALNPLHEKTGVVEVFVSLR